MITAGEKERERRIQEAGAFEVVAPFYSDMLMTKRLLEVSHDAFRVLLMEPIANLPENHLRLLGIRFVASSNPEHPDGKHFIVRTCCGKCYRVKNEGLGAHLWSIHLFESAECDQHAKDVVDIAEYNQRTEDAVDIAKVFKQPHLAAA